MSNVSRVVQISNASGTEAQIRELLQRLRARVLPTIILALLDGESAVRFDELIWQMRIERKRRSLARELVAWVIHSLRADGFLPAGFAIVE